MLTKKSSDKEAYSYAMDLYKGNTQKAMSYLRGWVNAGKVFNNK